MIRTLRLYLAKDLAKATLLSVVALTLVFTVLVIIEPLRERGLSSGQALKFFGYSVPAIFSLTLPIAALFAATIVYGRFSQDHELTACRASGISTLSLLAPAIWLGALVTAVTLALSLYVAPQLFDVCARIGKADVEQIVYHQLGSQHYVKYREHIVHVDELDVANGKAHGIVAVDLSDQQQGGVRCMVAADGQIRFPRADGQPMLWVRVENQYAFREGEGSLLAEEEQSILRVDLPNLGLEDEPKLYDWDRLWQAWQRPAEASMVQKEIGDVRRELCVQRFLHAVAKAAQRDGRYGPLWELSPTSGGRRRVEIETAEARTEEGRQVRLGPPPPTGEPASDSRPAPAPTVILREFDADGSSPRRTLRARNVIIRAAWERGDEQPVATLSLDEAEVRPGEPARPRYFLGSYALPDDLVRRSREMPAADICAAGRTAPALPEVARPLRSLQNRALPRMQAKVVGEINRRLAYAISPLAMVMLGAALGLLLRGGQVLVAFAITALPAALLIVLILMGYQMIANPDVPQAWGIAVIWGSVAALGLATAYVYLGPMRR